MPTATPRRKPFQWVFRKPRIGANDNMEDRRVGVLTFMTNDLHDPLGEGLLYEDNLPLDWKSLDEPLSASALARLVQDNESVLRVISLLEEHSPVGAEQSSDVGRDLARLDFKLNLLLDLVGQVLAQHLDLPAPAPLRLSARGIEWACVASPSLGTQVLIRVYLSSKYPRPLTCMGQVVRVTARNGGHAVQAAFLDLSPSVQDGLSKFIFRYHRRSVAHARAPRAGI